MNPREPESPLRSFGRLWRRAPIWRLTGLLAAVLTLWFLLFPWRQSPGVAVTAVASQASYRPQPEPKVAGSPAIARPAPAATTAVAEPLAVNPQPVQTAKLALATPDNRPPSADELDQALAGRGISGSLRVDGFDVPLPSGEWLQLAGMRFKQPGSAGEMLMLGRLKGRRLMGYVRIIAARSTADPAAGFRASPGCDHQGENTNVLVNEGVEAFGHQACWMIDHSFLAPLQAWADRSNKLQPLDRAAAGDLAAKGISYPQEMISVRLTRAETWGLLEVRYVFSPEEAHISSANVATYTDSDWQPANVGRYPEKLAYLEKLKRWGESFWPRFKAAFDGGQHTSYR